MDREEEKRLIARSQKGDMEAFDALVVRYERQVYNLAYRMTGNYDDANDVASEAFIRVFNAINRFRGDSSFSTWLYRIVTNVFLDERKRRQSHPHISLEEQFELEGSTLRRQVEDTSPGPMTIAEDKEVQRLLHKAIMTLPEFQREMITMYHILDLSYDEIAQITGLPIGTVKSRLNRARFALRDVLKEHPDIFLQ